MDKKIFYVDNNFIYIYIYIYIYIINDKFLLKRNKLLKGREFFSIIIYFVLLFGLDYLGVMDLYGQNIVRRITNMYKRLDPLNYEKKLKPFCVKSEKMLDREDIKKLQSIKIPDKTDVGVITRKNTITHQCCDNYSENEKEIIKEISEKIRQKYEKKVGVKLYYLSSNKATIYQYKGNNSQHLWHVDPQNLSEIYNIIVCIKKKGRISPLQCKNKEGQPYSINFEEGDAALFNGGTTVHQVPPNDDPNSERTVLSIAFTSSEKISNNINMSSNMCTYLEGGSNYINVIKLILTIFVINFILTHISGINNLSYKFLISLFSILLLITKYVPYYFDIGLGTGRASSIYYNVMLLLCFMITTVSTKGAIVFLVISYLVMCFL